MGKPIRWILRSVVQQNSETTGIQRIVLVGLAHALFDS